MRVPGYVVDDAAETQAVESAIVIITMSVKSLCEINRSEREIEMSAIARAFQDPTVPSLKPAILTLISHDTKIEYERRERFEQYNVKWYCDSNILIFLQHGATPAV